MVLSPQQTSGQAGGPMESGARCHPTQRGANELIARRTRTHRQHPNGLGGSGELHQPRTAAAGPGRLLSISEHL